MLVDRRTGRPLVEPDFRIVRGRGDRAAPAADGSPPRAGLLAAAPGAQA